MRRRWLAAPESRIADRPVRSGESVRLHVDLRPTRSHGTPSDAFASADGLRLGRGRRLGCFASCASPLTTGFLPGSTIASPPAFSIFSSADWLKRWAEILSFLVSSPSPRIFSSSKRPLARCLARSDSIVTSSPLLNSGVELADVDRRDDLGPGVVEAALGNAADQRATHRPRRSGWPTNRPSAPWPLWPRPLVLPWPEPGPRPTRLRFLCL